MSTSAILASWLEKQNNHPDDQHTTERRVFVSHLKLHHHVVEFVVSPTANKLTDMVFTWNKKRLSQNLQTHLSHRDDDYCLDGVSYGHKGGSSWT